MKIRNLLALSLLAGLMAPALLAQQDTTATKPSASTPATSAPAAESSSKAVDQATDQTSAMTDSQAKSDQNMTAHQPLQPDTREGFWGKVNPFARKKYVQRQMAPVRDRVNELDELTAANSKAIKDVDARAQQGIQMASAKANEADQHAIEAGNRANQANQTAQQASTRLQTVEQVVTNIDQYKPVNETEIRFRSGQTTLSPKAKEALDQIAQALKEQKGYIVEVQGFAPGSGPAAISASQKMAESVVRYLVLNHEIPVYRIYTVGMGNVKPAQTTTEGQSAQATGKPYRGPRVEVSVLKNASLDQLNAGSSTPSTTSQTNSTPDGAVVSMNQK